MIIYRSNSPLIIYLNLLSHFWKGNMLIKWIILLILRLLWLYSLWNFWIAINTKFINYCGLTFILKDKKRIKGTSWIVNVTIIDLRDNGPVINFFLQKKKFPPPHSSNEFICYIIKFNCDILFDLLFCWIILFFLLHHHIFLN